MVADVIHAGYRERAPFDVCPDCGGSTIDSDSEPILLDDAFIHQAHRFSCRDCRWISTIRIIK